MVIVNLHSPRHDCCSYLAVGNTLVFSQFLQCRGQHFHVGVDELRLHLNAVQREAGAVLHAADLTFLLQDLTLQPLQSFRLFQCISK